MEDNDKRKANKPKDKGKEKDTAPGASETKDDSVISRVTNSAAALSRSLMNAAPLASDLSGLTEANKSTGATTFPSGPAAAGESSAAGSHQQVSPPGASSGTFKPTHLQEHIAREEASFSDFLDSTPVQLLPETSQLDRAWNANAGEEPNQLQAQGVPHSLSSSVLEQQSRDGVEVVHLLSLPGDDELQTEDEETSLTEAELANLRQALFGADTTSGLSTTEWDHALNFIPDFVRPDGDGSYGQQSASQWKSIESQAHLGIPNSAESGRVWVEQWHDVLTRYTDEVWGDLGSLVVQAREELNQLEHAKEVDERPPETKALQRLRLILAHVRGY